ncbi:hypothetical protein FDI21_gp221 [Pseudomonas phage Noxifer]|uniref:Uncharacterized protein n=1 Tax=Pseudomonas phage Noxifer TaxID=2006684 RepID=A0A1Y0SVN3_9CAUD|nr:hypothetical protein FDI21_gp221 [Pseudomonas phage Noxifer]ARV77490.1 hypothetical protein NOXIFER_325 [Pseudomonas phage Noxifer]
MTVLKIDFRVNGVSNWAGHGGQPYLPAPVDNEQKVISDIAFLAGYAWYHVKYEAKPEDDIRIVCEAPFDAPDHRTIALLLHKAHVYLLNDLGNFVEIGLNSEERYFTFKPMPKEA